MQKLTPSKVLAFENQNNLKNQYIGLLILNH